MRFGTNPFAALAQQAGSGDSTAKAQLGRELEPQMMRIVRRVVLNGDAASSLDRRILAEAEKIGLDADGAASADGEFLLRQVARSVCSLVLARVKPAARDRCTLEDTVCG